MSWECKIISGGAGNQNAVVHREVTARLRRPGNTIDDLFALCRADLKDFDAGICVTFMSCLSLLARDNEEDVRAALERESALFELYLDICIGHVPYMKISSLSQMVNALSRLNFPYVPFYEAVEEDLCSFVKRHDGTVRKWQLLSPRSMTSISLALAKAVQPSDEFIEGVRGHARANLERYNGQDVCKFLGVLAEWDLYDADLIGRAVQRGLAVFDDLNEKDVMLFVSRLATLGCRDTVVGDSIADKIIAGRWQFSFEDLAEIAWAFAHVRIFSERLFLELAARAVRTCPEIKRSTVQKSVKAFAKLVWAFAVVDRIGLIQDLFCTVRQQSAFSPKQLVQLYHAELLIRHRQLPIPFALNAKSRERMFSALKERPVPVHPLYKKLNETLERHDIQYACMVPAEIFTLQHVVQSNTVRTAVEVLHEKYDYLRDGTLKGGQFLRVRTLHDMGLNVIQLHPEQLGDMSSQELGWFIEERVGISL